MIDPSSPTPTSVTAVNFLLRFQILCGRGVSRARADPGDGVPSGLEKKGTELPPLTTFAADEVEDPESRVKVKTSPSELRAAKVFPQEATLWMIGFAPTRGGR